jgi:hypothetical protein
MPMALWEPPLSTRTSVLSAASCSLICAWRARHLQASARCAALAEAVGDVMAPGRIAASIRTRVIRAAMPTNCSRRACGARPHRRQHPHQGHPRGDADKLFAQSLRRVDEQRLERHHCLSSQFERRVAGDLEVTDHLYFTITGLRQIVSFSRQNRTGGRFRVNDVGHAELAPELAPRASDFDGAAPACDERTAETGAIRTGSLAAKGMHGSMDPD